MTILWKDTRGSTWAVRMHYRARQLPPYDSVLHLGHQVSRLQHRDRLPPGDRATDELVRELRTDGHAQRRLVDLGAPVDAAVAAADRLCEEMSRLPDDTDAHYYDVPDEDLLREPEPYLFGLSAPLLDLAERYMRLPVRYLGVAVKREIANGVCVGTRHFHRDPEDENVLKIIVYLSDVDAGSGPFQCLDASDTTRVLHGGRYLHRSGAVIEEIERLVPRERWVTCLGPRLTASIADTARCLHRASPPTEHDRYSMTFSYLSARSYLVFADGVERQGRFLDRWSSLLDERQIAALAPPRRRFARRPSR
jgi:hypothetical protein